MSWFSELVGFEETSPEQVRSLLSVSGGTLTSSINGQSYQCGDLETATLNDLESRLPKSVSNTPKLKLSQLIADVSELHSDRVNAGALFQAASQFNLLEMASPNITPEAGVGIYENDFTQGPACAISCGAGTIFRNYFVQVEQASGQSMDSQIDCLSEIGNALENSTKNYWRMKNGYAFAERDSLEALNMLLSELSDTQREQLIGRLQVGIQTDTEVTRHNVGHLVSQIYCSALPVGYSSISPPIWEPFARIVLEGTYRATLAAGVLNACRTGNKTVYLTLVGGGVFNNSPEWIADSLLKACHLYRQFDLDCRLVSFSSHLETAVIVDRWAKL